MQIQKNVGEAKTNAEIIDLLELSAFLYFNFSENSRLYSRVLESFYVMADYRKMRMQCGAEGPWLNL